MMTLVKNLWNDESRHFPPPRVLQGILQNARLILLPHVHPLCVAYLFVYNYQTDKSAVCLSPISLAERNSDFR